MADGFQRLLQASTEARLWSWLSFLNSHEILLVCDLLSRDVRQQVESDPTLWSALVTKVFPRAALSCVLAPSVVPPPALPGSWKELFQLLTRLQDGSTAHSNLSSCLEIVPVRVQATHQVQVVAQSRLFCLTLPGGMSYSDGVYLRERLQDLHVMHKSKAHGLAKRKARSSIKNLVVKQAKACFVLTLRGTRLVLESYLLPSSQLCTVQLHDIVVSGRKDLSCFGLIPVLQSSLMSVGDQDCVRRTVFRRRCALGTDPRAREDAGERSGLGRDSQTGSRTLLA